MNLKSCAAAESASGHTRSREADNTRTMSDPNDAKRAREEDDDGPPVGPAPPGHGDAQEEDDGPVGPAMPPAKKKKTLPFEQVYLDSLPCGAMYEKSYMHRDFATHVAATPGTDFFITASADGHLKFWKKRFEGIEFVKHFRSHVGPVIDLSVSADGLYCATVGHDKSVKVYDVVNFDMTLMIRLPFVPTACEFVYRKGGAAEDRRGRSAGKIHVYDGVRRRGTHQDRRDTQSRGASHPIQRREARGAVRGRQGRDRILVADDV